MIGADSNGAVVASKASIADIDIERTSSDVATASIAQGDVEGARCVARERVLTNGGVVIAGCVIEERLKTHGRVAGADPVAIKCLKAAGSVGITGGVLKKRSPTNGRVVLAGDVFGERLKTIGGIVVGSVVLERLSPSGRVLCACRETKERFRTKSGVVGTSSQAEKAPAPPSAVLAPKQSPSGGGLTACALCKSTKQASTSGMRSKLRRKIMQFIKFLSGTFVTGRSIEVFIGFVCLSTLRLQKTRVS